MITQDQIEEATEELNLIGNLFCGMPREYQQLEGKKEVERSEKIPLKIKFKILAWLLSGMILAFWFGYQYDHDPRILQLQEELQQRDQTIKALKYEVSKINEAKRVLLPCGCRDHRVFKACADQPYLTPTQAAIIVRIESWGDPNCITRAYDKYGNSLGIYRGCMQIGDQWGLKHPYDPHENIFFGCKLYRKYLDTYKTWDNAITAFNAGTGNIGQPLPNETIAYIAVFKTMDRRYEINWEREI